jgi:4-carboxymuconolactone decarboxylase
LAVILAAREADCRSVWAGHVRLAQKAGLSEEVIRAVGFREPTDGLPDDEALIIEYARELLRDHVVSQPVYDRAQARFGQRGIIDLTGIIGYYTMLSLHMIAYGVQPAADAPQLP